MTSKITHISSNENFDEIVLKSDVPVIVDFYADWCGPCQKLGPILQEKSKINKNFKIVKVNVDDFPDISEKYEVQGIPFVLLFINGKVEKSFTGFDLNALEDMISLIK